MENPFIAKARLRSLRKYLPISRNHIGSEENSYESIMFDDFDKMLEAAYSTNASTDRLAAIARMSAIENIYKTLPHLDCGSCGAPNCYALAEDIVNGEASETDCIIKLREIIGKGKISE